MDEFAVRASDGHVTALRGKMAGSGPAVLVLPAMGVAARFYDGLLRALHRRGHPACGLDWRGQGASQLRASRTVDWSWTTHRDVDLPAARDVFRAYGHTSCVAWGHSLGGQLALLAQAADPGAFAGTVLVASGIHAATSWPGWAGRRTACQMALASRLAQVQGWFPGRAVGFGGRQARTEIVQWAAIGRSGRYDVLGGDVEAGFARIQSPIAGFTVEEDDWTPPASLRALSSRVPHATTGHLGPDVLPVDARGHFRWVAAPDAVVDAVAARTSWWSRPPSPAG